MLLDEVLQRSVQKRIAVKVKKQHRYLEINDIMYAESDKHVLNIHLKDSRVIQTTEKLSELKKTINSKRFIRCHQSYLVNMDYIKDAKTDFILSNDIRIPIRIKQLYFLTCGKVFYEIGYIKIEKYFNAF